MTNIKIYKRDLNYMGFESKGHADYEDGEYDIVCAAISILTQTLYFNLIDNCNIADSSIDSKQDEGYLKILLKDNVENNEGVQNSFNFMIKGLELLKAQYSKYFKLEIMEVQ